MISLTNVIKKLDRLENMDVKTIALRKTVFLQYEDSEPHDSDFSENAETEAAMILKQANEQAAILLQETEETIQKRKQELKEEEEKLADKVEAALEDARLTGFEEGYQRGRRDGEESVRKQMEEARRTIDASRNAYLERLQEAEPTIVAMAVKIAEKIIGKALDEKPEYWLSLAKTVLKEVKEHEDVKIYVHPKHYELTLQKKKELQAIVNHATDIYIYPDQELPGDGCLIETSFGTVDATVDSQLSQIKTQLLELIEEAE